MRSVQNGIVFDLRNVLAGNAHKAHQKRDIQHMMGFAPSMAAVYGIFRGGEDKETANQSLFSVFLRRQLHKNCIHDDAGPQNGRGRNHRGEKPACVFHEESR